MLETVSIIHFLKTIDIKIISRCYTRVIAIVFVFVVVKNEDCDINRTTVNIGFASGRWGQNDISVLKVRGHCHAQIAVILYLKLAVR